MKPSRVQFEPDPVIEAYKKDVDRTLLRENLKRSVEERFRNLMERQRFAEELRAAGRRARVREETSMPAITRLLETALYVDDLDAAVAFYRDVLGLRVMGATPRLVSIDAGEASVLLLFQRGATAAGAETPGGWIPPHDGRGPAHVAFAVGADALDDWERYLQERGVEIESRVQWDRGGRSIYFRDPDGHSIELVTPGTWPVY